MTCKNAPRGPVHIHGRLRTAVEHNVDGYFADLITVRTASGVGWFLDFVLLLEFQSNISFGNWPHSLRQVKSELETTEFGPITGAIINFWAAHTVSTKFLRGFKKSVSTKFLWGFKLSVSTKFLRAFNSSVHKVYGGFKSSVSTKFLGVSSQACPQSSSGFKVKCVYKVSTGFQLKCEHKVPLGFQVKCFDIVPPGFQVKLVHKSSCSFSSQAF
jgi:hypothetical protein